MITPPPPFTCPPLPSPPQGLLLYILDSSNVGYLNMSAWARKRFDKEKQEEEAEEERWVESQY